MLSSQSSNEKIDENVVEKITLKECKNSSGNPVKINDKDVRKLGPNVKEKIKGFEKAENFNIKVDCTSSSERMVLNNIECENLKEKETEKINEICDKKRKENWLEIAKKNLKKINENSVDIENRTPKSKHKKIYKYENFNKTPGSSTKKTRKLMGNRKLTKVNEIKKLWDKKKENTDDVRVDKKDKIVTLKPKVSSCKIQKILSSLDPGSENVKINLSEIQKPTKTKSSEKIDRWLVKGQRVGNQTKSIVNDMNAKDSKETGLGWKGQKNRDNIRKGDF